MLDKCMYSDLTCNVFGLQYSQWRNKPLIANSGWFSDKGEKLGIGDIDINDLNNIGKQIPLGETFFILDEMDTVSIPSELDRLSPGIDYVLEHAKWAVNMADIYRIQTNGPNSSMVANLNNVSYVVISRDFAQNFWNKKTINPNKIISIEDNVKKAGFYGLDIYCLSDGSEWCVGNRQECYDAAMKSAYNSLWLVNPDVFGNFIELTQEDKNIIMDMQNKFNAGSNSLIVKLLRDQVLSCCDYLINRDGMKYYLAIDGTEYNSDDVVGLPSGKLAYRVKF